MICVFDAVLEEMDARKEENWKKRRLPALLICYAKRLQIGIKRRRGRNCRKKAAIRQKFPKGQNPCM
jgi:hypothetical protein